MSAADPTAVDPTAVDLAADDLAGAGYAGATGVRLGAAVAAGQVSPVELTRRALQIAHAAEPVVNAYARLYDDQALDRAQLLADEAADGRVRSPLHGVPIAIKDNMLLAGSPVTKGSWTTSEEPATATAPMVERLLAAGVVIIGATTTPEFGWKGTGISPRTGVTRNPWDPSRGSGGSSAGSGATVGTGAVPIALGTDAGGSVRIPASFCGAVGLKPTLSTVPLWPGTVNESLSHAGVLTRSVADAAAVLRLTRGPDPRDPQSWWSPVVDDPVAGPTPSRPLRVGVVRAPFGIAPSDEVGAAFDRALDLAGGAGLGELVDVDLDAPLPRDVFEALWVTGRGLGFAHLVAEHGARMDPALVRVTRLAQDWSLADYYAAMTARRAFNAAMAAMLDRWDLLVMPTMPLTAFDAEAEVPAGGEHDAPLPWITWTPYTYPFNITGQPALTLPTGLAAGRMPVGVQVVGPWGADERVLAFAARLEEGLAPTNARRVAPGPWEV